MIPRPLIAVVDDDASLRQAVASLLKSYDIACCKFGTGEELLNSPTIAEFSCFLTDVVMPGMDGFELVEALRARGFMQPTIFMTAYKREGYAERAHALSATCIVSKPFETEKLMGCVRRALASAR